jgi:DNA ligase (NAD+)
MRGCTVEEVRDIAGIGEVLAQSVVDFFQEPRNIEVLDKLAAAGVRMEDETWQNAGPKPLAGLILVLTGRLSDYSRQQAEEALTQLGATVTGSVSKKTSAVIAGEEPGSKADRARELGIPVLDDNDLESMLAGNIDAIGLSTKE